MYIIKDIYGNSILTLEGDSLIGADLSFADLDSADFRYANMKGADLSNANCKYADFSDAILDDVDFEGTDLRNSILPDITNGIDFSSANLKGTIIHP